MTGAGQYHRALARLTPTERAAHMARRRHTRCDDLSAAAFVRDGEQVVYCDACGQPLLRWGGGV